MRDNPFSLDFGSTPRLVIPRNTETGKIISAFSAEIPSTHFFMILGARGNGKTVLMTSIKEKLLKDNSWIYVDLSPESEMLEVLAAGLYQKCKNKFSGPKLELNVNLKVATIGVKAEKTDKYTSIYTDLDAMLEHIKKKKAKVLITVDEAINSKNVREFTSFFQHCLREGYPVFLLMTGLYKNIRALQNNRSQTFLKRAPRIILGPLSKRRIAEKYKEIFKLNEEDACRMADYTNGYSYAFQILGYLIFESNRTAVSERILNEYRLILSESSYDKIWEELSPNERTVALEAAKAPDNTPVKDLRETLGMNSNEFSTYSDTLEKSGVFDINSAYGRVSFALPYIKEYILRAGI